MITKYFEQINIAYEDIKAGKYNKTVIENSEIIMYNDVENKERSPYCYL